MGHKIKEKVCEIHLRKESASLAVFLSVIALSVSCGGFALTLASPLRLSICLSARSSVRLSPVILHVTLVPTLRSSKMECLQRLIRFRGFNVY